MKNKLLKDSFLVVILVGIGKVLGFVKEMFIAKQFGICFETDVFFFAFGMTSILFSSIGSSIGTSFIPLYSEIYIKDGKKKAMNFLNKNVNLIFVLSFTLTILSVIFSKQLLSLFAPGFLKYEPEQVEWAIQMTRIMMVSIVFIGMQSIYSFALNAEKEYSVPAASNVIFNVVCIAYLALFSDKYGVEGLIWSVTIAFICQAIYLYPRLRKKGYRYHVDFNFNDEKIKSMIKLMIPVIIGATSNQINLTVDKIIVSFLGEGAISNLNYANKLTLLIYGIVALLISGVIFNEMVTSINNEDYVKFNKIFNNSIYVSLILMIPLSMFMFVFREEIISVLFQSGKFNHEDVVNTANVFMAIIPTMVIFTVRDIIIRVFYSIKDTKTPMKNGIIVTAINVVLSIVLCKFLGIVGVALATTISGLIGLIMMMIRLRKKITISYIEMIRALILSSIVSTISAAIVWILLNNKISSANGKIVIMALLVLTGLIFMAIYMLIIYIVDRKNIKSKLKKSEG